MATTTAPSIDPAEHVRQVEAEYTQAEAAMRATEAHLQQLDRQIVLAPGILEDLQSQLVALLSNPSVPFASHPPTPSSFPAARTKPEAAVAS